MSVKRIPHTFRPLFSQVLSRSSLPYLSHMTVTPFPRIYALSHQISHTFISLFCPLSHSSPFSFPLTLSNWVLYVWLSSPNIHTCESIRKQLRTDCVKAIAKFLVLRQLFNIYKKNKIPKQQSQEIYNVIWVLHLKVIAKVHLVG